MGINRLFAALFLLSNLFWLTNVQAESAAPKIVAATASSWPSMIDGRVTHADGKAFAYAKFAFNGHLFSSDAQGHFQIPGSGSMALVIREAGYRRVFIQPQSQPLSVSLEPQTIRGLYVSSGIFKNPRSPNMQNIVRILFKTEINALVIDYKDDEGRIVGGLKPFIETLHKNGIYAIARIVSMKDNQEPRRNQTVAIMNRFTGRPWEDRHHVTYLDPFNLQAHQYLLSVAKSAVETGFDEVEFDYIRFPTDGDRDSIAWSSTPTADSRTAAIAQFLKAAQQGVGGMGAFVAADVFGDTADVPIQSDSGIGQRIKDITPYLDYVCPMVYPSGYARGQNGHAVPVDFPGDMVEKEIYKYRLRAKSTVIRPWLQAFRDYAYNHRDYHRQEIQAQIEGAKSSGADGYLLWNAGSNYSQADLNAGSNPSPNPTESQR